MNPQDQKQEVPDKTPEPLPDESEAEEGFTLRFHWLILGVILLGLIWYFGWLKGPLYFLGAWVSLILFEMVLDYFERDKDWDGP